MGVKIKSCLPAPAAHGGEDGGNRRYRAFDNETEHTGNSLFLHYTWGSEQMQAPTK